MRPSVQPAEALRVSAADALHVHLQDQLEPRPQQGEHLLPVPAGTVRITDLARGLRAGREKPDGGVATSAGRSACERGVWRQQCRLQADKWDQGQQFTSGEPTGPGRLVQDQDLKTSGASRTRTQRPVQGRNVPLGCDVAEPEDDVDAEENSNGIVTVNEVRLQVFLWFRIWKQAED